MGVRGIRNLEGSDMKGIVWIDTWLLTEAEDKRTLQPYQRCGRMFLSAHMKPEASVTGKFVCS